MLAEFDVPPEQIGEFGHRKNIFVSEGAGMKVTWEAQILDDEVEEGEEQSQQFENDFFEMNEDEEIEKEKEKAERKVFSPLTREIQQKKRSFRMKKEETASEPPSDSPYKYTLTTNGTVQKKVLAKKKTTDSLNKIKEVSVGPSSSDRETVHPVFKEKKKIEKKLSLPYIPTSPQQRQKLESNRGSVLNRLNLKSVVYTGMVGILSGLAASQI